MMSSQNRLLRSSLLRRAAPLAAFFLTALTWTAGAVFEWKYATITLICLVSVVSYVYSHIPQKRLFSKTEFLLFWGLISLTGYSVSFIYFSDDQLRHIFDGWMLANGLDPFSVSPDQVAKHYLNRDIPGLPNHPDTATIYLPFTNLQAWAGHYTAGFPVVYGTVTLAALIASGRHYLLSYPVFWIFLLSGHGDVQAVLLILNSLHLYRKSRPYQAAILTGLAALIKPEALLFSLYPVLKTLRNRSKTVSAAEFFRSMIPALLPVFFWITGLCLQFKLIANDVSLNGWIEVLQLFNTYFISYRPDLIYLSSSGFSAEQSILIMRNCLIPVYLLVVSLAAAVLSARGKIRLNVYAVLPAVLLVYFFYRGSWQPWYFFWWIVFLNRRQTGILLSWLILFYLPVAGFRISGFMDYSLFYAASVIFAMLFLTHRLRLLNFRT